ncbi:gliding motility lipoprotein GldH [Parabacteroides sp. OttesenSCG-928-G21]|nr:gliding motility lipoprotein GldH [Parabacteroides sp. OttesenSCG-928-G21]
MKEQIINRRFLLLCVLFIGISLLSVSCSRSAVYDKYQTINNSRWEKDAEYYFTFEITDITVPYDLTLEVRNNSFYPFQNLWLFSNEENGNGSVRRDTFELLLADDFGKWHGKGISIFQLGVPLYKQYYFPEEGEYTIGFRQGMRQDELPGIQGIGLRVEKAQGAF